MPNEIASSVVVERGAGGEAPDERGLDAQAWADAFLIRAFEERLLRLFADGRLSGTIHTCIGQELTGVAVARRLGPDDFIFSNHRGHGHFLARTRDAAGLMAEIMGRASGVCGGCGGSQNLHGRGFFSSGVQGGNVPVAAGLAMSQRLGAAGGIAVCFIGDGTLGQGVVYESFNLASKWGLPLAVLLENNMYAQSTRQEQTLAGDICRRAEAFGLRTFQADVWSPAALFRTVAEFLDYVRGRQRPAFLRVDTYRLAPHSGRDDQRDPDEVERYRARDPLACFARERPEEASRLREAAERQVSEAVEGAAAAGAAGPGASRPAAAVEETPRWRRTRIDADERMVKRITFALGSNMERDGRIICLGQDIESPYGGAFKVTAGLSRRFPGRVRNTPISEGAVVGLANGLALAGRRPVVEIMFSDFLTLAADQLINHAAKFRYMYGEQVSVPVVIRFPSGGRRGYGPTHSQSLEKHFLGLPDTRVLALHHRFDPALVYDRLFATLDRPTLVVEHKLLYGERVCARAPEGFVWEHTEEDFPTSRLRPCVEPDLTIVCYGGMLPEVERAVDRLFEEHELVAEVVCPVELYPLRLGPVLSSVAGTRRLLVVEEGQTFCGFGAELLAAVHERAPELRARSRRLGPWPSPIPAAKAAEAQVLPRAASVVAAALDLTRD